MIETAWLPVLFLVGAIAGLVDSVAGGGGMITLPVLLSLGIEPQVALGTNKLQAVFGSFSASLHYANNGAASPRKCAGGFVWTFLGASAGTLSVRALDSSFLRVVIPVLLIGMAAFMIATPGLGQAESRQRLRRPVFDLALGIALGFYDGFFGPGTGTFWTLAFMTLLGLDMVQATGNAKVMNFASNLASLVIFALCGTVLLLPGCVMGVGQVLGAQLGARLVITRGVKFVRPVFLSAVIVMAIHLLLKH